MNAIRPVLILAAAAAAAAGAPVEAGMPFPRKVTCPVGGKSFTHTTTGSYTVWGQRPDGKPYGSWHFPLDLPKCPDNKLVVFDDFKPAEVEQLAALIATAEYRSLAAKETDYFLAAWLMERLGRPAADVAWVLVQASWQADDRPELKARYQGLYVDRIRALPRGETLEWLALQGRAANALRELDRFDEANALLESLDLSPLDVPVPEENEATPNGSGREAPSYEEIEEARSKRYFLGYFQDLERLIAARDSRAEPLRMIPAMIAADRCRGAAGLTDLDKEVCASEEMQELLRRD